MRAIGQIAACQNGRVPLDPPTRKAGVILACIAAAESAWVTIQIAAASPGALFRYFGFADPAGAGVLGWTLGAAVALVWVLFASRLPSVRENLARPSWLKLLALALAVSAAMCEEAIFRKLLMTSLQARGYGIALQIVASALAFGAAHSVWGLFRGSIATALAVTLVTGALGFLLAIVFVASARNLAPCVASHFFINLFVEPGLVLAAVRGEMRRS